MTRWHAAWALARASWPSAESVWACGARAQRPNKAIRHTPRGAARWQPCWRPGSRSESRLVAAAHNGQMREYCGCQQIAALADLYREHEGVVALIGQIPQFARGSTT